MYMNSEDNTSIQAISQLLQNLNFVQTKGNPEMADKGKRDFILLNLKSISPFSGQKDHLALYIDSIESIIPEINTMQQNEKTLFYNYILRKRCYKFI